MAAQGTERGRPEMTMMKALTRRRPKSSDAHRPRALGNPPTTTPSIPIAPGNPPTTMAMLPRRSSTRRAPPDELGYQREAPVMEFHADLNSLRRRMDSPTCDFTKMKKTVKALVLEGTYIRLTSYL